MSLEVYRSSAGSGKTTTLVRRFLSIILASNQPDHFRHVLAITFTNKAAGEMKERILSALNELANHEKLSDGISEWVKDFSVKQQLSLEMIRGRAAATLSRILHLYSEFSVSTIDKFSHRIIRQFAFDLGISSDFRVELDSNVLIDEAVQRVINKAGEDEVLTRFLVSFIVSKAEDEKGWNIEGDIAALGGKLFDEASEHPVQLLSGLTLQDFLKAREQLQKDINAFKNQLGSKAETARNYLQNNHLRDEDFSNGTRSGFPVQLNKLVALEIDNVDFEKFEKYKYEDDFFRKADKVKAQFSVHIPHLIKLATDISDFYDQGCQDYFRKKAILPLLYALGSLIEIQKALDEISREENLLHISRFNRMISSTIKDEPAPYIYERLGEKYRYIFIDEFQDTSVLQWQNLVPLVEHVLATDGAAMLVGDAKQSIYRWRGGESEQFRMLPKIAGNDRLSNERSNMFERLFSLNTLDSNHRSAPEIVNFNNSFFHSIKQHARLAPWLSVYEDVNQIPKSRISAGAVWINPLPEAKEKNAEESYELVLQAVLDFINLTIQKHRTQLKDITILTRNRKEGSNIAAFLLSEGIHVVSPESILINRSTKVNALIAGLSFLCHFDDGPSKLTWLYSDTDHPAIPPEIPGPGEPFYQARNDCYRSDSPSAVLHALCKIRNWSPLNDIFLQFFFDRVADYEMNAAAPSCYDFLQWWSENEHAFNVILPDGMDAVQIMTVHKSKGLQFPVVVFPFFDFDTSLKRDTLLWAETDPATAGGLPAVLISPSASDQDFAKIMEAEKSKVILDSINLLYVALTRACNHLALIPSYPNKGKQSLISEWLETFMAEHPPTQELGPWCVYGHQLAALSEKVEEPVSAQRQDVFVFNFQVPKWAKPDYSFSAESAAVTEGLRVHEHLSMLAHGSDSAPDHVKRMWDAIRSHPRLDMVFTPSSRFFPEREICSSEGDILRPDLLVEQQGLFHIIDYKTGAKDPKHSLQIQSYAKAMRDAGFKIGEVCLVYLSDSPEVEKIAC